MKKLVDNIGANSTTFNYQFNVLDDIDVVGFLFIEVQSISIASNYHSDLLMSNIGLKRVIDIPPNERIFKFEKKFLKGDLISGIFKGVRSDIFGAVYIIEREDGFTLA